MAHCRDFYKFCPYYRTKEIFQTKKMIKKKSKILITEIFIDFFNLKNIILIFLILISENNVRETLNLRCKEHHMISYKNKLF